MHGVAKLVQNYVPPSTFGQHKKFIIKCDMPVAVATTPLCFIVLKIYALATERIFLAQASKKF